MKFIVSACFCLFSLFAGVTLAAGDSAEKVHAKFVNVPKAEKPIQVIIFHGLGRKPETLEKWAKKKFENEKKKVFVKVLDYKKVGLAEFEQKIANVLGQIEKQKDSKAIAETLQKEEAKLLPELRQLVAANIDTIKSEFGDTPLENIIVIGYSMGGLISSVVVEVLGNSGCGQVQSLLTSTAPPVGLINCKLGVEGDIGDGLTESTVFPWTIYSEIGDQDEIFVNGVAKVLHCFSIFDKLDADSKKHFVNKKYKGTHKSSETFHTDVIKKTIENVLARQKGSTDLLPKLN